MSSKLETKALLDCTHTIAAPLFEGTKYPWEVLDKIEKFIMEIGPTLSPEKYDQIGDNIWIAKTANVAPSAMLNGPLIICERAEVRHCAFIRGKAIIGEGSVVGNST